MNDVEEVRSRLNIVDIVGTRVQLKKAGRNFKGLCPFHGEKTPSFIVSPDRQTFHCFGCGKGGSIFDFVMEYDHVEFGEALEMLADKAGVTLERRTPETPEARVKEQIYAVNHLASEYYQYILTTHALGEKARMYLKNRGISDKAIKTFGLGYSPNNWEALSSFLVKKGYDKKLLETAGLLIPSARGGYDRFRGRVMFTLKDHRGHVVGFAGRLLDPNAKEAKYINTSETPVYSKSKVLYGLDVTKDAIGKAGSAIIMEGEIDVISSFQAGVSNVVAIKGSALTEGHVLLLRRYTERLIFALDSDMAGDSAARRGIEIADRAGMDMKVVRLPSGKDPDEAVREDAGAFKKAIDSAIPIYDYFLESAVARFGTRDAFGKKKIADEVLPLFAKIENSIVQSHYADKLADLLGVSVEVINTGLRKAQKHLLSSGRAPNQPAEATKVQRSRREKLEIYLLALLLQGKTQELFDDFKEHIAVADIEQPIVRKILERMEASLLETHVFLLKDFIDSLPPELAPIIDEASLWDMSEFVEDEALMYKEWTNAMRELKRATLKGKIQKQSRDLTDEKSHNLDEQGKDAMNKEFKQNVDALARLDKST